jgi:hypothetical protein
MKARTYQGVTSRHPRRGSFPTSSGLGANLSVDFDGGRLFLFDGEGRRLA